MSKNDEQIKALLKSIEAKKASLGVKPRAAWKTNGILKIEGGDHININTVNQIDKCVDAVAYLLKQRSYRKEAAELLGVQHVAESIDDYLDDFKLRAQMVAWDAEKRKLDAMESKLKDLRSEDAKTADAISDIISELGT